MADINGVTTRVVIVTSIIFLGTAVVSILIAYDRMAAILRFSLLALGVFGVIAVVRANSRTRRRYLRLVCRGAALFVGMLGVHVVLARFWGHGTIVHNNAAGGALALTLPYGIASIRWSQVRRRKTRALLTLAGVLVGLLALTLTGSRGAWLALFAGGCAALLLRRRSLSRPWTVAVIIGIGVVCLAGFWSLVNVPSIESELRAAGANASTLGRIRVWRDMVTLVQDYPFTGSGLDSTTMVYSTYVLLLHVPFLYHAHNMFLQVAVEQGLIGMIALLSLLGLSSFGLLQRPVRQTYRSRFRAAAVASLAVLVVHGMLDAELYVSRLAPLTFLPIGVALLFVPQPRRRYKHLSSLVRQARMPVLGVGAVVVVLIVTIPVVRSAFQTNLGTAWQTRTELSIYRWPAWLLQDDVRRAKAKELGPAVAQYEAALRTAPNNATAHRRLGQIMLAQSDYAVACRHLEAAHAAEPNHHATGQLLGECYALRGEIEEAVALWQSISVKQGNLTQRRMWYEQLDVADNTARISTAISYFTEQ